VVAGPGSGYVATFGDADEGVDAWEGTPRAAVTAVAAEMHWDVRQVLAPAELTVAEAWQAAAEATRVTIAHQLDEQADALDAAAAREGDAGEAAGLKAVAVHHREQAAMVRAMRLPGRPS
jgi:hypothetical protein